MSTGIVNIHGRDYETVALRIKKFREQFPGHSIVTELLGSGDDRILFRAVISDEQGRMLATGHSEELRGSSQINKTSAVENCETSAIGRALAAFGLGGTEFASANEVQNAVHQQESAPIRKPKKKTQEGMTDYQREQLTTLADTKIGESIWIDKRGQSVSPHEEGAVKLQALLLSHIHDGGPRDRIQALIDGASKLISDWKRTHPQREADLPLEAEEPEVEITDEDIPF